MKRKKTRSVIVALWICAVATVLFMGLWYLPREYRGMTFWHALYTTLRLFVFERDLDPFPKAAPLIFIYFAAPLISLSALGTALTYMLRLTPWFKAKWMYRHTVVCGMGRIGRTLAESLKARGWKVLGVDLAPDQDMEDWSGRVKVPVIKGDFFLRRTLERARAQRAKTVIFASGDDLANLNGALAAYEWMSTTSGPVRLIWTHIANEELADTARSAVRTRGNVGIRYFDTYRIAATQLISSYFNRAERAGITEAYVLGFGKFGRDLTEMLLADFHPEESLSVHVYDIEDRSSAVEALSALKAPGRTVTFERASIEDLTHMDRRDIAIFLCTDDDLGNLTLAMRLSEGDGRRKIYVRMNQWPLTAVSEHFGRERGLLFINTTELTMRGVSELPGMFKDATASDLKRLAEDPPSPRAEEPASPRAEEPASPRTEEPASPGAEEPVKTEGADSLSPRDALSPRSEAEPPPTPVGEEKGQGSCEEPKD